MTKQNIWNEATGKFELVEISDVFPRKRQKEVWNYKTKKYELQDLTEEDLEFERELEGKICEFCHKNKATGYTHSGGSKVFHCSQCVSALGQDAINSRLPRSEHTEEMLKTAEFLKLAKED